MHRVGLLMAIVLLIGVLFHVGSQWRAVGMAQARVAVAPFAPGGDASGMRLGLGFLGLFQYRLWELAGYLGLMLAGFAIGAIQGLDWRMSQLYGGFYAGLLQWSFCVLWVGLSVVALLVLPPVVVDGRSLLIGLVALNVVGGFLVLAGLPSRGHRS